MSKDQFLKKGKVVLSHTSSQSGDTEFIFSADKHKEITITAINDNRKSHFELEHTLMDSGVECLIEWLQKKVKEKGLL